jgi:ribosomal protein S18 acetylase RimI-like enzyme
MEAARRATGADLDRVVELAAAAAAELGEQRGGKLLLRREARRSDAAAELAALVDAQGACLAVGTIDGQIVGYGVAETHDVEGDPRLGVIRDLYVEPAAREVGVGEAIAGLLIEFLAGQGCAAIDAYALPGNRATKNFFESHGFTARLLVMHRLLDRS